MAKTSTTSISVSVLGDGVAETYTPPQAPIVNAVAPAGGPISVALAAGDNTMTAPPGAVGFLLVPPSASAIAKKLKGIAGDTGFGLAPAQPSLVMLPTGATTVLMNASALETVQIHWL